MSSDSGFQPVVETVKLAGRSLTVAQFGASPASIVMLHDGLGSISQWRGVPSRIAEETGVGVLAYDRSGHGKSQPIGQASTDWLHSEADVLQQLLERFEIIKPLIVGHSDGGSIALIHGSNGRDCQGVVTLAAHSFVEDVCVSKITALRANPGPIVIGLARHHEAPRDLFDSWSAVWVDPAFRHWDIRPQLNRIACPVLVVQGDADEFATAAQLTETVDAVGDNATAMALAEVGHVIHHQAPETVVTLVADFYKGLS